MISFRSFAFTIAVAALPAHALAEPPEGTAPELLESCWDETFAYNVFTVERTASHYYVTLSGSQLVDENDSFTVYNNVGSFTLTGFWNRHGPITIPFTREECSWDDATRELDCRAGTADFPLDQDLYVVGAVDDLGQRIDVISKYRAGELAVSGNPTHGLALEHSIGSPDSVRTETLQVRPYIIGDETLGLDCQFGGGNGFLNVRVPQRLVDYLEPQGS